MINADERSSQGPEIGESRMQTALSQLLSSFHLDVMYTKAQTSKDPGEFHLQVGVGLRSSAFREHTMHPPLGQGGWAWVHRTPIWTNDYYRDNRFCSYHIVQAEGARSMLCVPFVSAGLIIYGASRTQNAFSDRMAKHLEGAISTLWLRTIRAFPNNSHSSEQQPLYRQYDCSEREWNILYLLTLGLVDEEMAEILSIEACTIRFHLRRLQRKLDCRNRTHLATTALRLGIVI